MSRKKFYLIDATAFCYRAFYALKDLSTSFGQPTNAIYGFVAMLQKIMKTNKPDYIAACFDVSRDTFRQKKFAEYKMQRPPMPQGLSSQLPLIKEIVAGYGITIYEKEGFEADDVIASICKKALGQGVTTVIVSSDKDMLQLVEDGVSVLSPYKDEGLLYTEKEVKERFGIDPGAIPDIIALMGDDVDNIPGVPGIGEKTAVELIKSFGSVDNLLKNIDSVPQEKLRESIREHVGTIRLNKELAVLDRDVGFEFELEQLKVGPPDTKALFRLFKHLEFKRFLKELAVPEEEASPAPVAPAHEARGIREAIPGPIEEAVLYIDSHAAIGFLIQGKLFVRNARQIDAQEILGNPGVKKIGHDLKSAMLRLAREGVRIEGMFFDTMVAAYLANPSRMQYRLQDVAWDFLGEMVPENNLGLDKASGVIASLKVKLEKELADKSLVSLFRDIEMPLVEVLADMELHGIKLDVELLRRLSQELEKKLIGIIEDIYALSGCQFNINSPKQLREILFEKLKLPIVKRGKTGPSTDEEVLTRLASSHELPARLLEYRQLTKLKNTYIDTLPHMVNPQTGMIHTSFNQTGTETGRLSSSNPNLQNIPIKTEIGSQIRRAVIASSAQSLLFSFDYSQIELRILAHLSGDQDLIKAFKEGRDIHRATAALIYGVEEQDVDEPLRETAKRVNFGIVYGLTSWGLARDLGIPVDVAGRFIEAYFTRYPGVDAYIQEQIAKAKKDGFVTTILGRRRYIPEIHDSNQGIRQFAERKAVNTPIQGSASDLIKLAMVQIHRELISCQTGARMVLQIHDELVFDVPRQRQSDCVALVRERMENVLSLKVPVKVSIKKGANWLEMEDIT